MRKITGILFVLVCLTQAGVLDTHVAWIDSLAIIPEQPSSSDSLEFEIYTYQHDCFTQYHNQSASLSDTNIYLWYEYETIVCNTCGACFPAPYGPKGFKLEPQNPGIYQIYKAAAPYCEGPICPMYAIVPQWIGSVTVSGPSGIISDAESQKKDFEVYPNPFNPSTTVKFPNPSRNADAVIYDTRGRQIFRQQGITITKFKWSGTAMPAGIYLLKIKSAGIIYKSKLILAK